MLSNLMAIHEIECKKYSMMIFNLLFENTVVKVYEVIWDKFLNSYLILFTRMRVM